MSEWQPIDSAPKDCFVLLFCPGEGHDEQRVGQWCKSFDTDDEAWRYAALWCGDAYVSVLCKPTHWMPLPDPPVPA